LVFDRTKEKQTRLWVQHIDGLAFRKLGAELGLSGKQVFVRVEKEINRLPDNLSITKDLTNKNKFSGILIVDGKFVKVKGHNKKIPFIFGIDYTTHDIVHDLLTTAEDTLWFERFFRELKEAGYPLKIVVSDERAGVKTACLRHFPRARFQLCTNHYLENIRQLLNIRTQDTYQHFFNSLRLHVFTEPRSIEQAMQGLMHVRDTHTQNNPTLLNIIMDIYTRQNTLLAYHEIPQCPNNTNLIELYNSHLNGRLKTIKGFQSFTSAERWLNAYILRRRTKVFTDCETKFKHLNNHSSLEQTIHSTELLTQLLAELYS
jgi:transposase-like protein